MKVNLDEKFTAAEEKIAKARNNSQGNSDEEQRRTRQSKDTSGLGDEENEGRQQIVDDLVETKHLLTLDEIGDLPRLGWLIRGVVQFPGMVVVPGWRGSFKSFLVWGWMVSIALGIPWLGHETRRERVLYVVGEGVSGIPRRRLAMEKAWDISIPGDAIRVLRGQRLWKSVAFSGRPDLSAVRAVALTENRRVIVMDTLSSLFGGMEENGGNMTLVIDELIRLAEDIGGVVIVVHHTGKDPSKGGRGHSSFEANPDQVIAVRADENVVTISTRDADHGKFKDGPAYSYDLRTRQIDTGLVDEYGQPVTSLVLEKSTRSEQEQRAGESLWEQARTLLDEHRGEQLSTTQIVKELGLPEDRKRTLNQTLKRHEVSADVKARPVGRVKVWWLP